MNPFKGSPRFGLTPVPETPYQRAGQAWDARIGAARVQAANWRLMALGLVGLSACLGGSLAWLAAQGTVTPWVVEIDRLGEVRTLGPAVKGYRPTDEAMRAELARLIRNLRAVSTDGVVVARAWENAYAVVEGDAARFVTEHANAARLQDQIGKSQVSVEVRSVLRASPRSFRATWTETRYVDGAAQPVEHWTAILTVELRKPRTDAEILANGLGLKVSAISWQREAVA